MFSRLLHVVVVGLCAGVGLAGCEAGASRGLTNRPRATVVPPGRAGTIAEYAHLVGPNAMLVRGYGIVVGLGRCGSSEVPPPLRRYLTEQMLKHKLFSPTAGTGGLSPARMLSDLDTAVVVVKGRIPAAAPVGVRFDLQVEALPGTQTVSLDGGVLMTTELHLALDSSIVSVQRAKSWAVCRGPIFVNPFARRGRGVGAARLRVGRVLNGGIVTRKQPIRLELRRPDYRVASLIERRINQRFGIGGEKVANAKTSAIVDLQIPRRFYKDHGHFLELVLHVYLQGGAAGLERHARQLARAITLPTALHEDISLVWEAMGREVLPVIRPLYTSENRAAAFYSARAGLRLGDVVALEPMIYMAKQARSAYQLPAIRELGRARSFVQTLGTLQRLLNSSDQMVRYAAYEALVQRGGSTMIRRVDVAGQFDLDVVQTEGPFAVYAASAGPPRIVLFGQEIPIRRPVFYCPADELVTINALAGDKTVSIYRKVPRTGKMSETFKVSPTLEALIRVMGKLPTPGPDGRPEGLGLTYSQVVGVLYGLSKENHIPAKFVLQRPQALRRIYDSTPAMGRPDMPDEEEAP